MLDLRNHEIIRCSINEYNGLLKVLSNRPIVNCSAQGKNVGGRVFAWQDISKAMLVYNEYGDKIVTRVFETDLNNRYEDGYIDNIQSVREHAKAVGNALKFPRVVKDKSEATVNATGILWYNEKYSKTINYCYEYDMHLAWLSMFMTCKLPDTTVQPRTKSIVGENEIGFLKNGSQWGDTVVFEGYADYIFPVITNPNPKYTAKLLKSINEAPTKLKRLNLKMKFNEWLGTMQNKNPYIRVAVIAQSNKKIMDIIHKYKNKLIFSVTDSLGATERIPELDNMIGNEAGCWSIKSEGYMYEDRLNRLYLDDKGIIKNVVIRGVPKEHLIGLSLEEYKKLTKYIDPSKNLYVLNFNEREIIVNE